MSKQRKPHPSPASANCNAELKKVERYMPDIGAPFSVVLIDAVQQRISPEGEVLETHIPNLDGLLKEVAFTRALNERKFSPEDIRFVRKAVGLKAGDLADLLGMSAEHVSRCENGDRTLSVAAEKLLRVIVLKKRHNPAELAGRLNFLLKSGSFDEKQVNHMKRIVEKYRETVEEVETAIFDSRIKTVFDPESGLEFEFYLVPPDPDAFDAGDDGTEESWQSTEKLAA